MKKPVFSNSLRKMSWFCEDLSPFFDSRNITVKVLAGRKCSFDLTVKSKTDQACMNPVTFTKFSDEILGIIYDFLTTGVTSLYLWQLVVSSKTVNHSSYKIWSHQWPLGCCTANNWFYPLVVAGRVNGCDGTNQKSSEIGSISSGMPPFFGCKIFFSLFNVVFCLYRMSGKVFYNFILQGGKISKLVSPYFDSCDIFMHA